MPIKFLRAVGESLIKQKQQAANADSVAVAKLACLIHGALGAKKNSVSLDAFLPFEKPKDDNDIKESTVKALKWAMKNESLPPAVVGMIGAELS